MNLLKKELGVFVRTPLAYIITGVLCLIVGWMFFNLLVHFVGSIQVQGEEHRASNDFLSIVIIKFFGNLNFILLLVAPILSMRSFSDELKDQTLDLLLSSPLSNSSIVIQKFLSIVLQAVLLFLFTLIFFLIIGRLETIDYSVVLSGYVGVLLNYMLYSSIGIFASSLTRNAILSALITFAVILFMWSMTLFAQITSNYFLSQLLLYFSLIHHFEMIIQGNISLSTLMFYFSGTFLLLFLTKKNLEFRRLF